MESDDRFRGQDPDHEYVRDDELSTSRGGYDEADIQQDPGAPEEEYGQDEHPSDRGGDLRDNEGDPPEDDPEGGW